MFPVLYNRFLLVTYFTCGSVYMSDLLSQFSPSSGGSAGKESACNVGDLGWEDPLEKGKATYSSILELPWWLRW